jgi:hypothetical protein
LFSRERLENLHGQDAPSSKALYGGATKVTDTLSADLLKTEPLLPILTTGGYIPTLPRTWKNDGKNGRWIMFRSVLSSSPTYGAFLSSQNISYSQMQVI